jgi:hypothetical protein
MNQEEQTTFKELKKELNSLNAKVHRRDEKIDDLIRNEDYLKSVITQLNEDKIRLESKLIILQRKSIDR